MICKLCGQAIEHTFATFFLSKKVHLSCEMLLDNIGNVMSFPFLRGLMHIDYLLEKDIIIHDPTYIEQRYLCHGLLRAINQKDIILWQDNLIDNDILYLLFILDKEGLYWVFLQNPSWVD